MTSPKTVAPLPLFEFVVLMALLMSQAALSIDAALPALPEIARSLNVTDINDTQLIVSMIMLGMGIGQIFYGPLCDSWGRKPTLYAGMVVFIAGSVIAMTAGNLQWMLIGRITQGLGLASTRVVSTALIRDLYSGRFMARIMSFIMMVFIIVPMIAPTIGQIIYKLSSWMMIFFVFVILAIVATLWFAIRQPETLTPERRKPFTLNRIGLGYKEVLTHRAAMAFTLSQGLVQGCFLTYLSASQSIFEQCFGIVDRFPMYFAAMAGAFGVGALYNSSMVVKVGMIRMVKFAMTGFISLSSILLLITLANGGVPPFLLFFILALPMFLSINILFSNLNAMAMQPLGHLAGIGAAVVGSLSTLIAVLCSVAIGQNFHGTLDSFFSGYVVLGICAALLIYGGIKAAPGLDG